MQSLVQKLIAANEAYRNGANLLMTDDEYDEGIEMLARVDPNHPLLFQVGATVGQDQAGKATKLPHRMASLDKAKVQEDLTKFIKRQPDVAHQGFVLSEKLDGISGLWSPKKGKLYLRGNGIVGVDVSNYLPHLQLFTVKKPTTEEIPEDVWIRGELILPKSKIPPGRLGRSITNGIFHHDVPDPKEAGNVRFVAYEIIGMAGSITAQQQMAWIQNWNLFYPWYQVVPASLPTAADLTQILETRLAASEYDMDGIVIRTKQPPTKLAVKGNPTECIAWKPPRGETKLTKVIRVEWNASANGRLVPRVEISPVALGGSTITYVTGTHARRILDWKVGPDAMVVIRKGGDVIPVLDSVQTPSPLELSQIFPSADSYEWDGPAETAVNIKQKTADKTTQAAQLLKMVTKLEWDNVGPSQLKALVEAGYATVPQIRKVSEADLKKLLGPTKGAHFYKLIQTDGWLNKNEITLFLASPIGRGGIGSTKLEGLAAIQPDVTLWSKAGIFMSVKGWSPDSLKEFQVIWAEYETFRKTEWAFLKYPQVAANAATPGAQAQSQTKIPIIGSVVFSGFRDAKLEENLIIKGYKVSDTVKADTKAVLIADKEDPEVYTSTKVEKAKNLSGCRILQKSDWTLL
jgi:NAD-dependent DNA ligase